MPDLIAQGAEWLTGQRRDHMSREVVYAIGASTTVVLASIARTEFEVTDGGGAIQRHESRDFIIAAADMPAEPARGHRIVETIGSRECVYEVMAPVQSEPAWRWADAARTSYRIHTKLVAQGPAPAPPEEPI